MVKCSVCRCNNEVMGRYVQDLLMIWRWQSDEARSRCAGVVYNANLYIHI